MIRARSLVVPALVAAGLAAGFGREMLLAHLFGASREIGVFRVALGLPSILSNALAVSFVAVLMPVLLADGGRGEREGLRAAVWASLVFASGLVLVGVLTMPLQAVLLAPGIEGDDRAALVTAGRICWGMTLFVLASLPLRALMSARGRIWPAASAPLMQSAGFGAALLALSLALGWTTAISAALAALLAGLAVLGLHLLALGRQARLASANVLARPVPLSAVRALLPALLAVLAAQLLISGARILDRIIASTLDAGVLAAVEYGYAVLMAAAAVLATSTNVALAPRIARAVRATGRIGGAERRLIGAVTAAAVALGVLLSIWALPVVSVAFERGSFGAEDALLTARILAWQALGLGPLVLALLLTQLLIIGGLQRRVVLLAPVKLAVKAIALPALLYGGMGVDAFGQSLVVTEAAWAAALSAALLWRR